VVISGLFVPSRLWENFLHGSCRARRYEFVDIKFAKIGVRMKKLWTFEVEKCSINMILGVHYSPKI
jgi:hypothetical protein